MSVGELADLLAVIALCVLVALAAAPLIRADRALDEVRIAVRGLGHNPVPVLVGLRSTVENTNAELERLSLVTNNVAHVSGHATVVNEHAANLSQLFAAILDDPLVRGAAIVHGLQTALEGHKK